MFTLCYYSACILPLNVYCGDINLSYYYAAVMLPFKMLKVYYATID